MIRVQKCVERGLAKRTATTQDKNKAKGIPRRICLQRWLKSVETNVLLHRSPVECSLELLRTKRSMQWNTVCQSQSPRKEAALHFFSQTPTLTTLHSIPCIVPVALACLAQNTNRRFLSIDCGSDENTGRNKIFSWRNLFLDLLRESLGVATTKGGQTRYPPAHQPLVGQHGTAEL
jgi:hypothetical protein